MFQKQVVNMSRVLFLVGMLFDLKLGQFSLYNFIIWKVNVLINAEKKEKQQYINNI